MKVLSKLSYKAIGKLVLLFILMLIFSNASINEHAFFFAYPLAFSMVFNGIYPICTSVFYTISSLVLNFTFANIVSTFLVLSFLVLMYIIQKVSKKKRLYLLVLFTLFSRIANIYFNLTNIGDVLWSVVDLCFGLVFLMVSNTFISKVKEKSVQLLSISEKSCFYLLLIPFFSGISGINIYAFSLSKLLIVLVLFASAQIFQNKSAIICLCAAIGTMIGTFSVELVPIILAAASIMLIFRQNKFLAVGAASLVDALIIYIEGVNYINIFATIFASIIFVCLPSRLLKSANSYIFGDKKPIVLSYLAEKNRLELKNKLLSIGMMFAEMQNCYKMLVVGNFDEQEKITFLATSIKTKICSSCINYMQCYESKDMLYELKQLIETAIKKEKANILDVSNFLASNCVKLNLCISQVNSIVQDYKKEIYKINQDKESKLALSMHLAGTEEIFKNLSSQFSVEKKINEKKSQIIKNLSIKAGIFCKECLAIEGSKGVAEVYMVVKNSDAASQDITKIISKIYQQNFEKAECVVTKYSGWALIKFVPLEKFEIQCGIASKPKEIGDKSGDNYVFAKLNDGKYLIAICDGMGHGEEANKISLVVISLMQSLYNCGLSSNLIMQSINSLIVPSGASFTTIDATVVDTNTGEVDFIKMGSSVSLLKKQDITEVIDVESLPIGVSESVKPTYKLKKLYSGDVVVLASDGVVDVFGEESLQNYVNNENTINMQTFAQDLLNEALARKNNHKDDMTVVVYKLANKR